MTRRSEKHRIEEPLLRLGEVTAGYGKTTVLNELSFEVGHGEIVGLVGRNGAGKTTTLRAIMGSVTPRSGTIVFDGREISGIEPEGTVSHGIALVPEERRIFQNLTVRENLRLAALGSGTDPGAVGEVLATFENLKDRGDASGMGLSGGEQQMLAIARAMVGDAKLLLLDEPTEGLAPGIVDQVVEIIEALRERGRTVLLVEQNVHVALDVCDFIYLVENGQIAHAAPSAELRENEAILEEYLGVST